MNNREINYLLHSLKYTKAHYLGTFAADTLPNKQQLNTKSCLISNTRERMHPGEHWVAVFKPKYKKHVLEYFDSYGFLPNNYLKKMMGKNFKYHTIGLQHPCTNVCGQYGIYFLYHRCKDVSFKNIIKQLSEIPRSRRDLFVHKWVKSLSTNSKLHLQTDFIKNKQICKTLGMWLKKNKIYKQF